MASAAHDVPTISTRCGAEEAYINFSSSRQVSMACGVVAMFSSVAPKLRETVTATDCAGETEPQSLYR